MTEPLTYSPRALYVRVDVDPAEIIAELRTENARLKQEIERMQTENKRKP